MSGHSKWSTIKRKKGIADAERSKIFQKLATEQQYNIHENNLDLDLPNKIVNHNFSQSEMYSVSEENGYGTLILGNNTSSGSPGNKRGSLRIYGPNNIYTNIMAANLTTNRSVYIRDYGVETTYFVGVDSASGKGSANLPIYIDSTGKATACSSYAGGTAITLNGTSKAASTASFYAPTSAGTAGYILKSGGTSAPSWI